MATTLTSIPINKSLRLSSVLIEHGEVWDRLSGTAQESVFQAQGVCIDRHNFLLIKVGQKIVLKLGQRPRHALP